MQNHHQPDPLAACKRDFSQAVAAINAGILAAGHPDDAAGLPAERAAGDDQDNATGNVNAPDALL
jgi:hypothetical protein